MSYSPIPPGPPPHGLGRASAGFGGYMGDDALPPLVSVNDPVPHVKGNGVNYPKFRKNSEYLRKYTRHHPQKYLFNANTNTNKTNVNVYGDNIRRNRIYQNWKYNVHCYDGNVAYSVYLDLYEYSSIHKYQVSPYFSYDLQEYQYYVNYLTNPNAFHDKVALHRDFIDSERDSLRSSNTYNYLFDNALTPFQPNTFKRASSTIYHPLTPNDSPAHFPYHPSAISYKYSYYKKSSKKASTANIYFSGDGAGGAREGREAKDFYGIAQGVFEINMGEGEGEEGGILRGVFGVEPGWVRGRAAASLVPVVLNKKNRLQQYLNYLTYLEIFVKKRYDQYYIDKFCDRSDIIDIKELQKKHAIKVHFEKEQKKSRYSSYETEKFYSPLIPLISEKFDKYKKNPFSAACSTIMSTVSEEKGKNGFLRNRLVDFAGRKNYLRYQKDKIFNKSADFHTKAKLNGGYPLELYSICSYVDLESNFSLKDIESQQNIQKPLEKRSKTYPLKLLKLLLIKLSSKTCSISIKDPCSPPTLTFSYPSPISPLSPKLSSLTQSLYAKYKYIFEIKQSYDYVIGNYVNCIANLTKCNGDDLRAEFLEHYYKDNFYPQNLRGSRYSSKYGANGTISSHKHSEGERLSKPMTFKMSHAMGEGEDSRGEEMWIGAAQPVYKGISNSFDTGR